MNEDKKLSYEEQADLWLDRNMDYVSKCIDEYEADLKSNPNRRCYTLEESNAETAMILKNWEKYRKNQKCIS